MYKFNDLLDGEVVSNRKYTTPLSKHERINKTPWVDKYRPKKLNEVVQQEEVILMLKKTLKNGNLPHMLFWGIAGTGKTSTILAVAMELFGPRKFKDRVIELNASDERGINIVRNKIVTFAKTAIGTRDPKYPCPPYKIIILDEADAMTTEAQSALRKTIEENSKITRFCFICNYINQIIEPITSRCVKFRFKPLTNKNIMNKLSYISIKENMVINKKSIKAITNVSKGDLRRAIMLLQNLQYIYKYNGEITEDDIYEMVGTMPTDQLKKMHTMMFNDNVTEIMRFVKDIGSRGYPISNVILEIHKIVIHDEVMSDIQKAKICINIAKAEKRLIDGADEYIQLLHIMMHISKVLQS